VSVEKLQENEYATFSNFQICTTKYLFIFIFDVSYLNQIILYTVPCPLFVLAIALFIKQSYGWDRKGTWKRGIR